MIFLYIFNPYKIKSKDGENKSLNLIGDIELYNLHLPRTKNLKSFPVPFFLSLIEAREI